MAELTVADVKLLREKIPTTLWEMIGNAQAYIAGGFIRDTLAGDTPKDLDIFSPYMPKDFWILNAGYTVGIEVSAIKAATRTVQFTFPNFPYPVQIIQRTDPLQCVRSEFDFTVNSVAIDQQSSWAHDDFYAHLKDKLLVVANDKSLRARTILHRMFRLVAKGYTVDNLSLAKIISVVASGALARDGFVENEDRLFKALLRMWKIDYDPEKGTLPPAMVGKEAELAIARYREWRIAPTVEDYNDPNRRERGPE